MGYYQTSMEKHVRWEPTDTGYVTAGYPNRDAFTLQNVFQLELT